jgi:hypothetical protein
MTVASDSHASSEDRRPVEVVPSGGELEDRSMRRESSCGGTTLCDVSDTTVVTAAAQASETKGVGL